MRFNIILICSIISINAFSNNCEGHFVNPIKDVCWRCLFPISIGNSQVVKGRLPDTNNGSATPILKCTTERGTKIGLKIGFWEPIALTDVTDTPYCLVNLGGHKLDLGVKRGRGGKSTLSGSNFSFYHVHWYIYPLITWLNIITSQSCVETQEFDVAYLTELDPSWIDSEMSLVLNPETILFANPIAQVSCAADSISSTFLNKPINALFWCAGAQGSHYPLTGFVDYNYSPVQTSLLLTERLNYKLHRLQLINDSTPDYPKICSAQNYWVIPKNRYRYEMVNQVADGKHCYPSGHSTLTWEAGKIKSHTLEQYGYLVWRKRNCVFL